MKKGYFSLLIIITLVLAINTFAEEDSNDINLYEKLLNAKTLKFVSKKSCTANWEKGKPELSVDSEVTEIEFPNLIFDSIDLKKATARLIGNQGATDVKVIANLAGLTFIEQTGLGSINITTVFSSCIEGTEDYIAVHSRHIDLGIIPLPSQTHGICKIIDNNYLKANSKEELFRYDTMDSENIQISEIIFTGIPLIKILNENGKEGSPERLPKDRASEYKCSIAKRGDKYFWQSRENVELSRNQSGIYTTFVAKNGSGYIRIIDSKMKKVLFEKEEQPYDYMEHLITGLSTITYYGTMTYVASSG
jgi:hypothetical protein